MESPTLTIGARRFDGWTRIEVTDSLESEAPEFTVSVSDRDAARGEDRFAAAHLAAVRNTTIKPGQRCTLDAGGDRLVTGFVDAVHRRMEGESHTMEITGAGATADLVDSSAMVPGGEFTGFDLAAIARALAKPFGIPVRVLGDIGAVFASAVVNPGEKVSEFLARLAATRQLMVYGDETGGLVIGRIGGGQGGSDRVKTPLDIASGRILAMEVEMSQAERYRDYIVRTQTAGSDGNFGTDASEVEGRARDGGVGRPRTLMVVGESGMDRAGAMRRAEWERRVRIGRGTRALVTVQGWRRPDGKLWRKGVTVPVDIPLLPSRRDLVVSGVRLTRDNTGTRTALTLVPMEALEPAPDVPDTDTSDGSTDWSHLIGIGPPENSTLPPR